MAGCARQIEKMQIFGYARGRVDNPGVCRPFASSSRQLPCGAESVAIGVDVGRYQDIIDSRQSRGSFDGPFPVFRWYGFNQNINFHLAVDHRLGTGDFHHLATLRPAFLLNGFHYWRRKHAPKPKPGQEFRAGFGLLQHWNALRVFVFEAVG